MPKKTPKVNAEKLEDEPTALDLDSVLLPINTMFDQTSLKELEAAGVQEMLKDLIETPLPYKLGPDKIYNTPILIHHSDMLRAYAAQKMGFGQVLGHQTGLNHQPKSELMRLSEATVSSALEESNGHSPSQDVYDLSG